MLSGTWPQERLAAWNAARQARTVEDDEPVIYREEVKGLLFMVADISVILRKLYVLLGGEDEEEEAE